MKISIITINYNNKVGLKSTIDSVISQTYTDYEWVVVDGGSADGSRELIESYKDHFGYWCCEPDKGIYNAMNKGIAHAHGEYLLFLNSGDSLVDSNVLTNVAPYLEDNADIVYGNAVVTDFGEDYKTKPEKISMYFLLIDSIFHQSTFINKNVFRSRIYDEKYKIVSDWKLWIECFIENRDFKHIPVFVARYELTGASGNNDLNKKERNAVLTEMFSPAIKDGMDSLIEFHTIEKLNPELTKILKLLHTRRLYKRIINWMISSLEFFDRIRS